MTDLELQQLTEALSLEFFKRPFLHRAYFNSRLKTTGGRYHLRTHEIDINPLVVEKLGKEELARVIKHELCHYHLHLTGRGYRHRDPEFKQLLTATGASRYVPPLKESAYHVYQCTGCLKELCRRRRFDTKRYVCGHCGGRLEYKGMK